jgi:hypothetical protein
MIAIERRGIITHPVAIVNKLGRRIGVSQGIKKEGNGMRLNNQKILISNQGDIEVPVRIAE